MKERSRRLLCRLCFLLFGLAPTCGVVGYVAARQLPYIRSAEREHWESVVRKSIGASLHIADVSQPTWGVTRWTNVRWLDGETDVTLATVDSLEIYESVNSIEVAISKLEVHEGQLSRLVGEIHERLLRQRRDESRAIHLSIDTVLTKVQGQPFTLIQFDALAKMDRRAPELRFAFRVAGDSQSLCVATVHRNRDIVPPETELSVEMDPSGIDTLLLSDLLPSLAILGRECRMNGRTRVVVSDAKLTLDFTGGLIGVDCDQLVTSTIGRKFSCRADVVFRSLAIRDGRLSETVGRVEAGPGIMSDGILESVAKHLPVSLGGRAVVLVSYEPGKKAVPRGAGRNIPFYALAIDFRLDGRGLILRGNCDDRGTAILDHGEALATTNSRTPIPVVSFIRALVPNNELQAPVTRQTEWLTRVLPVSEIVVPGNEQTPWKAPSLRLQPKQNR